MQITTDMTADKTESIQRLHVSTKAALFSNDKSTYNTNILVCHLSSTPACSSTDNMMHNILFYLADS